MRVELASLVRVLRALRVPWVRVLAAVGLGTLTLASAIGLAAVSAWLIARASQRPLILDLTVAVTAVRAFGISRGIFRYFERLASHDVALRGVAHLREQAYARLAAAPAGSASTVMLRRGDLLTRFGSDIDAIGDAVVRALMPALVAVVTSVASVILIGFLSPAAAVVLALALLGAGGLAPLASGIAARRSESATVRARSDIAAMTMSVVDGADELRVLGRLEATLDDLETAENRLTRALRRASWPASIAPSIATLGMGVTVVATLIIGGQSLAAGTLSPVALAVVVLTPLAAFEAVETLPAAATQTLRSAAAARRLEPLLAGFLAVPADRVAPVPAPAAPGSDTLPRVTARDLAIGYPGGEPIRTGINLSITPGTSLAIVGASGIGKTTLLATLAGLLPPAGGEVEITGTHPAEVVVFTAEDAHVFDTSILENLRVARGDVTSDEACAALTQAGLSDLLAGLPEGVHTRLGENATTISGGERRRLLLARALLSPAPILLLDEPGEHLDVPTADALVADMLALAHPDPATNQAPRGIVVVTHRPGAVAGADAILRMT